MKLELAPSILSADFCNLAASVRTCTEAGAERFQFDVMDGRFVPNISFGTLPIKALRPLTSACFEAHLMVVEPERWIEQFAQAGAEVVIIHAEAAVHLQRALAQIRAAGSKAGLALNPATPLDILDYVLEDLDQLLIMTVNPGFGGQQFLPASLQKIAEARARLDAASHPIDLEVDGGIDAENARAVADAGANVLVAGTGIFGHAGGPAEGIRAMRAALASG